eukprot:TRINITY_DN10869_c0_g2_i4.p1 TRINITY_DN10869_c0_g2~~TRINITY_DN10869_c0_g2_i4.p1  ORF type:complete len:173 (+),score=53.85 TRINITY_DN10869_c0_g2_i4:92-610(+)
MALVVYVQYGGETRSLECDPDGTVRDLAEAAQALFGVSGTLTYQGREMPPDMPIADSGVCSEAVLHLGRGVLVPGVGPSTESDFAVLVEPQSYEGVQVTRECEQVPAGAMKQLVEDVSSGKTPTYSAITVQWQPALDQAPAGSYRIAYAAEYTDSDGKQIPFQATSRTFQIS